MNVLLIDDDITCLKSIGKALTINGIPNRRFISPREAVDCYRSEHFDVVVTDLKMPEMNGIEVLKAIRTINPEANVIILTAYDDDDKKELAYQNGVHSFLHKSIPFENFLDVLMKINKTQGVKKND